jgi:hypothetical protein
MDKFIHHTDRAYYFKRFQRALNTALQYEPLINLFHTYFI